MASELSATVNSPSELSTRAPADRAIAALPTEALLLEAEANCARDREPLALAEHVAAEDAHGAEAESDVLLPVGDVAGDAEELRADEVGVGQGHGDGDAAVELAQGTEDLPAVGGEIAGLIGGHDLERANGLACLAEAGSDARRRVRIGCGAEHLLVAQRGDRASAVGGGAVGRCGGAVADRRAVEAGGGSVVT